MEKMNKKEVLKLVIKSSFYMSKFREDENFSKKEIVEECIDFIDEVYSSSEYIVRGIKNKGAIIFFVGDSIYINFLYVEKKERGNGLGSKLLKYAIDYSKKKNLPLTLSVYKNNYKAIMFYKNHDFKIYDEKDISYDMYYAG